MSRNFVVSANFLNRSAGDKWLVRPYVEGNSYMLPSSEYRERTKEVRESLVPHKAVFAQRVEFTSSSWESGFGCSMVAIAEKVNTENVNVPNFAGRIRFNGQSFVWDSNNLRVNNVSELWLLPDGSMYGRA